MNRFECHGVMMEIDGFGILIRGPAACGKSELALELVRRGHRLVADDTVVFFEVGDRLVGESAEIGRGLLAVRGLGILDLRLLFGADAVRTRASLDLLLDLKPVGEHDRTQDLLGYDFESTGIGSAKVARAVLSYAMPGAVLATRAECTVRRYALCCRGYDSRGNLSERMGNTVERSS